MSLSSICLMANSYANEVHCMNMVANLESPYMPNLPNHGISYVKDNPVITLVTIHDKLLGRYSLKNLGNAKIMTEFKNILGIPAHMMVQKITLRYRNEACLFGQEEELGLMSCSIYEMNDHKPEFRPLASAYDMFGKLIEQKYIWISMGTTIRSRTYINHQKKESVTYETGVHFSFTFAEDYVSPYTGEDSIVNRAWISYDTPNCMN